MANELRWATIGVRIKEEFTNNREFNYITIDADGSVCAWAEKPEYDSEQEMWHGDDWFTIGVLKGEPAHRLIDYSEEIYSREMYDGECNYDEPVKIEGFNASELRRVSDRRVRNVILNNIKDSAEKAASSGQYSAFCWVGWIPEAQRQEKVDESIEELEKRGFTVQYDRAKGHINIEW